MMKNALRALILSIAVMGLLAAGAAAQGLVSDVMETGETGQAAYNVATGGWTPGGTRMGALIYDNGASARTWWPVGYAYTHYIILDWGVLYNPPTSGMPDEIIDGFQFRYSTTDRSTAGIDLDVHFYDSRTGSGNLGVLEAVFPFTGLPNATSVAPGVNKSWMIDVDLSGTGYEFIVDPAIGWGYVYHNGNDPSGDPATGPVIGKMPLAGGNGPTGTENVFDVYNPDSSYFGSYFFGGTPWATWPLRLWGGAGISSKYYGIAAQGNHAELYESGNWYGGSTLTFMMRDPSKLDSYLLPSLQGASMYLPGYDVTRHVGNVLFGNPIARPMLPDPDGRFDRISVKLPNPAPGFSVYFQGASFTVGSIPPIDMSNGIKMN